MLADSTLVCPRCSWRPPPGDDGSTCPQHALLAVDESDVRRAPRDAFLGTMLGGRYPILGLLGQGGMGAVYRSLQPLVDRPVAIKVILPNQAFVGAARERFLREARTIARLQHPSIVTLFDFGAEPDGTLYMVLELVDGVTFERRLQAGGMTVAGVIEVGLAVLDGLARAHQAGVVHRDIKPENVMLLAGPPGADGRPQVKILDFGVAKLTQASAAGTLTEPGMVCGSPLFMSPEQAMGAQAIDHRTDLYSLAAMLYEALCGQPPHAYATVMALLTRKVVQDAAPLPLRDDLPRELGAVIDRGLARDPAARWASADEMAAALRSVQLPPAARTRPLPPLPRRREKELQLGEDSALDQTDEDDSATLLPAVAQVSRLGSGVQPVGERPSRSTVGSDRVLPGPPSGPPPSGPAPASGPARGRGVLVGLVAALLLLGGGLLWLLSAGQAPPTAVAGTGTPAAAPVTNGPATPAAPAPGSAAAGTGVVPATASHVALPGSPGIAVPDPAEAPSAAAPPADRDGAGRAPAAVKPARRATEPARPATGAPGGYRDVPD